MKVNEKPGGSGEVSTFLLPLSPPRHVTLSRLDIGKQKKSRSLADRQTFPLAECDCDEFSSRARFPEKGKFTLFSTFFSFMLAHLDFNSIQNQSPIAVFPWEKRYIKCIKLEKSVENSTRQRASECKKWKGESLSIESAESCSSFSQQWFGEVVTWNPNRRKVNILRNFGTREILPLFFALQRLIFFLCLNSPTFLFDWACRRRFPAAQKSWRECFTSQII